MVAALLIGALLLAGPSAAEESATNGDEARERVSQFMGAARTAVEDATAALVLARLERTQQERKSQVFTHYFTVEEVVKPLRNDEGVYYIPTAAAETTGPDKEPKLKVGEKYAFVVRMRFGTYGWQHIDSWCSLAHMLEAGKKELDELRVHVKEAARYGSNVWLNYYMKHELDVHGRRAGRADGYMEPAAFGLSEKQVREAVEKGGRLLLVRIEGSAAGADGGCDLRVHLLEEISGGDGPRGDEIVVHMSLEYERKAEGAKLKWPYHSAKMVRGYVFLLLVRPRKEGPPTLEADMSPCGRDDCVVREVRSWFAGERKKAAEITPKDPK